ncbi:MAG: hypothetical protein WCO75_10705, partial [Planctomycetota bacterium]
KFELVPFDNKSQPSDALLGAQALLQRQAEVDRRFGLRSQLQAKLAQYQAMVVKLKDAQLESIRPLPEIGAAVQDLNRHIAQLETTLGQASLLTGSAVDFNGKLLGGQDLTVTAANIGFNGATTLASLTSNGATSLGAGTIDTTGAQTYNGATTLASANTLTGSAVAFNGTVSGACVSKSVGPNWK